MKECPCKNCELRYNLCHSNCPKDDNGGYGYKSWKNEYDKLKSENDRVKQQIGEIISYKKHSLDINRRRH